MAALTGQIRVSTPPDQAFSFLGDPTHSPLWIPYLRSARQTSAKGGRSLQVELTASIRGRQLDGTGSCVEWDPPTFFAWQIDFAKAARATVEVEIEASVDDGCAVYVTVDLQLLASGIEGAAVRSLAEQMLKQELVRAMSSLRQQLTSLSANVESTDAPAL